MVVGCKGKSQGWSSGNMEGNWIRIGLSGWGSRAIEVGQAIRNGFKMCHLTHVMMALWE